jgi:hypothetical protein
MALIGVRISVDSRKETTGTPLPGDIITADSNVITADSDEVTADGGNI